MNAMQVQSIKIMGGLVEAAAPPPDNAMLFTH